MSSFYTWAWISWLLVFCALELPGLLHKNAGWTLSEHIWDWFSIKDKSWMWQLRRFVLLAFLAWLAAHFLTGGQF